MPSTVTTFLLDAEEDGLRCTSGADGPFTPVEIVIEWPEPVVMADTEPDYDELTSDLADALHLRLHEKGYLPVSPTQLRGLLYKVIAPGGGEPVDPAFECASTEPLPHPLAEKARDAIEFSDRMGWAAYSGFASDDQAALIVVLRGDKAEKARAALLAIIDMVMHDE